MKKYSILLILNLLCFSVIKAQTITTVVGTGVASHTGDGAAASSATINNPIGIFVKASGDIYISDQQNHCIRKVTSAGVISTIAGIGTSGFSGDGAAATLAHLNTPGGVFVDAIGNVYFADGLNNRIRMVNTAGIISTIAGNGTAAFGGDGTAATTAMINNPIGVALDASGNLFIADQHNHRIRKVNSSGIISTIAGTGSPAYGGDGGPATSAQINYPNYVIVDDTGNVYFTDNGNHRIRKINAGGSINTVAGNGSPGYTGDGSAALLATLYYPAGIRKDSIGNIYIADYGNNVIRKVDAAGMISTIAGNGTAGFFGDGGLATSAKLNLPSDVAYGVGHIYISDYTNNRIRMITDINHPPHFTHGILQTMTICENSSAVSIDSFLSVIGTNIGQTETWTLSSSPSHGVAVVTYTTTSTGGMLVPTGLSYTPNVGYSGTDGFKVSVTDGIASDETQIDIIINPLPDSGAISGIDSVCPGHLVTLMETVPGGVWSVTNMAVSAVGTSGVVAGVAPGYDSIIYTVTNSCGSSSAIFPFIVRSYASCMTTVISPISNDSEELNVFPNPSTNGEFTILTTTITEMKAQFIVTDIIGRKIKEFTCTTNNPLKVKLDVSSGLYFLSVLTEHQKWAKKLMVNNQQ